MPRRLVLALVPGAGSRRRLATLPVREGALQPTPLDDGKLRAAARLVGGFVRRPPHAARELLVRAELKQHRAAGVIDTFGPRASVVRVLPRSAERDPLLTG